MKKFLTITAIVVLVLFALTFDSTKKILGVIGRAFAPVFLGVFFALLLKAPVSFLEKTILHSPKLGKFRRPLSLTITLVVGAGFLALIGYLVFPELIKSLNAFKDSAEWLINGGLKDKLNLPPKLEEWLEKAFEMGSAELNKLLPNMINMVGDTVKGIINGFLGLMLGITMLSSSKATLGLGEKIASKLFGAKEKDFLKGTFDAMVEKFSRYLGGSVVEAIIFSIACYLTFLIFKVPYALLVAVIVGLANLIPTLGGYVGGGIGALIIFTVSPTKSLVFIAIMLVIQQVEQVTTYPIVVGKYVGLSPFFVLLAVVIGGGLFGFWGLLLGVPVFAFIYNLVSVIASQKTNNDKLVRNSPKNAE